MTNRDRYICYCYQSVELRLLYHRQYQEHGTLLPVKLGYSVFDGVVGISKDFDATWKMISNKRGLHSFTEEDIEQVCFHNGLMYSRYDTNGGVLYFQAQKAK